MNGFNNANSTVWETFNKDILRSFKYTQKKFSESIDSSWYYIHTIKFYCQLVPSVTNWYKLVPRIQPKIR